MKLEQFLDTCNTNTIEIEVYNKYNDCMFEGMLYLIFHNTPDKKGNELSEQHRQELLDSTITAWEVNSDDSLSIFCDY